MMTTLSKACTHGSTMFSGGRLLAYNGIESDAEDRGAVERIKFVRERKWKPPQKTSNSCTQHEGTKKLLLDSVELGIRHYKSLCQQCMGTSRKSCGAA